MKNDELRLWYRRYGPLGPDAPEPVFAEKGEGAWLGDAEGGKVLDFASGGSAPLGYNHPDIRRTLNQVGHAPGSDEAVTSDEVALMQKLAELVPGGMNRRVLVCESGREALARAIELARNETDRTSVTYLSRSAEEKPAIGKDVAAVVAHPLDGRIKFARQACDAAGALLIDDEAGIGPGTAGRMLAIELSDVRPDIYVLGRGWAAGFPFGSCVTRSSTLRWKCATAGNPMGCALALETIRLLESGLLEQGRKLAAHLEKRFGALSSPKLEPELWGVGLVRTIVLRKGRDFAEGLAQKCREHGLLLQAVSADTIAVRPPLVAREKDIDLAAEVVGKVLAGFDRKE
ncbi:MAG TPA: aminotransferase class III-fold pyridoxal phosphate-dependent enzyme [bacterium]|nr:aminotransferase class III-fold pyridoxal phosphate-dependent enzyme [bacterium]